MEKAINYGLSFIGAPYCHWKNTELKELEPAYNGSQLVDKQVIFDKGIFCAGLVNLMLTSIGLKIPEYPPWSGGIYSYQMTYNMYPFDLSCIRRGDAIFRPYQDINDQGHIGIALGNGDEPVLQCFPAAGVNVNYTVRQSHCGSYYKYIIKREDLSDLTSYLPL